MITYDDNIWVLFRYRGSVMPKAFLHALPAPILALLLHVLEDFYPGFHEKAGMYDITEPWVWTSGVILSMSITFRTYQALGRFWQGTSLLHKMMGEWFDVATLLTTFSRDALTKKEEAVHEFRQTLIRLMSLMNGSALDEISVSDTTYPTLDIRGLDRETLQFLRNCIKQYNFNRVEALQHQIQVLITHNHHLGVLNIAPPILGRVYQSLSRGLVNLFNAKMIKDTMFPFPYAQMIYMLLVIHCFLLPVIVTQVIESKVIAALFSFLPNFGLFSLNFIAAELEMPFGKWDNDLPLNHFQSEMNNALLMLVNPSADDLPSTCAMAVTKFRDLANFKNASELRSSQADSLALVASHSKSIFEDTFWEEHETLVNAHRNSHQPRFKSSFGDEPMVDSTGNDGSGQGSGKLSGSSTDQKAVTSVVPACAIGSATSSSKEPAMAAMPEEAPSKKPPLPLDEPVPAHEGDIDSRQIEVDVGTSPATQSMAWLTQFASLSERQLSEMKKCSATMRSMAGAALETAMVNTSEAPQTRKDKQDAIDISFDTQQPCGRSTI